MKCSTHNIEMKVIDPERNIYQCEECLKEAMDEVLRTDIAKEMAKDDRICRRFIHVQRN